MPPGCEEGFLLQFLFYLKIVFIFRQEKGGREGEKHQCVVVPRVHPTGTWPTTQSHALDWESNPRPFG